MIQVWFSSVTNQTIDKSLPAQTYLLPSLMLRLERSFLCAEMNARTQSGFVLLKSRKLQPIALLMKNSFWFRLFLMISSNNTVSVLDLKPS